eukprot:365938-Chlamydomonas_euryale.AAC.1
MAWQVSEGRSNREGTARQRNMAGTWHGRFQREGPTVRALHDRGTRICGEQKRRRQELGVAHALDLRVHAGLHDVAALTPGLDATRRRTSWSRLSLLGSTHVMHTGIAQKKRRVKNSALRPTRSQHQRCPKRSIPTTWRFQRTGVASFPGEKIDPSKMPTQCARDATRPIHLSFIVLHVSAAHVV